MEYLFIKTLFLIIYTIIIVLFVFLVYYLVFTHFKNKKREELKNEYLIEEEGNKEMKESHLIIGALVRDGSKTFDTFMNKVYNLTPLFDKVSLIVLENDSEDDTREKYLKLTKEKNEKLEVYLINEEKFNLPIFSISSFKKTIGHKVYKDRIDKMVYLRNDLMNSIKIIKEKDENINKKTYVLLTDADIDGEIDYLGVNNTFSHFRGNKDIEAIGFLGFYQIFGMHFYFDTYAFKKEGKNYYIVSIPGKAFNSFYENLVKVDSSFSGGVFYRYTDKFINTKYMYREDKIKGGPECEHVSFNENFDMYVNTNMLFNIISH